jgi:hypothetical protein
MSANKIWNKNIPDKLISQLDLHQTNLSRTNLLIEKRNDAKQSIENTGASTSQDLTLIVAPIILLVMSGIAFFHKLHLCRQANKIKLDESPCKNCHFFSKNNYLNCAVNPVSVSTKAARNCCDYQPLSKRAKMRFLDIQSRRKLH